MARKNFTSYNEGNFVSNVANVGVFGSEVMNIRTLGNIIWILLGGIWTALAWAIAGIIFYISIIGIPLGRQAFKMAALTLAPFGKTITYGGSAPSMIANIIWVLLIGIWEAIAYVILGAMFCITVVGIPFGFQIFKMAKLSLFPFGAVVE